MEVKCPKCGCAVLADSVICTRCGAPRPSVHQQQAQLRNMSEGAYCAAQGLPHPTSEVTPIAIQSGSRKVDLGLILGIVFMPYIFAWFTLRHGYSRRSRLAAFTWLGCVVLILIPK